MWDRVRAFVIDALTPQEVEGVSPFTRVHVAGMGSNDLRHSQRVGEILESLWQMPLVAVPSEEGAQAQTAFLRDLTATLRGQTPQLPIATEERYDAVATALAYCIQANIPELSLTDEPSTLDYLKIALYAVYALRAPQLHDVCCTLLLALDTALVREREGNRRPALESLRYIVYERLAALPPDGMPRFWDRLNAASTSEAFWPVVRRMRGRRAVPFLLGALPLLPPDGQSAVIKALREMKDSRAIPTLQALAEGTDVIAPVAKEALAYILRHSRDDAAQLLRPTDARHAGNPRETLLRPAAAASAASRPEELLRPGSAPEEKG